MDVSFVMGITGSSDSSTMIGESLGVLGGRWGT